MCGGVDTVITRKTLERQVDFLSQGMTLNSQMSMIHTNSAV